MFASSITAQVYQEFISSYQSLKRTSKSQSGAYVYADRKSVRLIADLVEGDRLEENSIFALSVAKDGWMEFLALYE